jgi:nucleotide-binding universal stress UspA family protein
MTRIVVGTDGSAGADRAVRWAAEQAELRGASLEVICARHLPWRTVMDYHLEERLEEEAEHVVAQARQLVTKEHRTLPVRTTVALGPPAPELVKAAEGAEMLVVGSHGHGVFRGAVLGSVSLHCVAHSPCPITVVRGSERT